MNSYPSTRYRGSKRKLLPWIADGLSDVSFDSALDIFGGTGSVSYLFKKLGKSVTYNDHLKFNYHIGKALVENDSTKLTEQDIDAVLNGLVSPGFINKYYKNIYYTDEENEQIERMLNVINNFEENSFKRSCALYALFQACLTKRPYNLFHRANLNLRTRTVKRTFGNKVTWEKPLDQLFRSFALELNSHVFKGNKKCKATCISASQLPPQPVDLIYLDPPYIPKSGRLESADYERCYNFLEGLSNLELWESRINLTTKNHRYESHADRDWVESKNLPTLYDSIFDKFEDSIFIISYKKNGKPSIDTILRKLKSRGRNTTTVSKHYKYSLNKQNGDSQQNREVLIKSFPKHY